MLLLQLYSMIIVFILITLLTYILVNREEYLGEETGVYNTVLAGIMMLIPLLLYVYLK